MLSPISHCINDKLLDICKQSMALEALNVQIQHYLPEELKPHVTVGSFKLGALILVTNDPAWACQLRFLLPNLRDRLRKEAHLYQLTGIHIQSNPPHLLPQHSTPTPNPPTPLSTTTCETIKNASLACDFAPLSAALERLAR
jgi:hypothetical protein